MVNCLFSLNMFRRRHLDNSGQILAYQLPPAIPRMPAGGGGVLREGGAEPLHPDDLLLYQVT